MHHSQTYFRCVASVCSSLVLDFLPVSLNNLSAASCLHEWPGVHWPCALSSRICVRSLLMAALASPTILPRIPNSSSTRLHNELSPSLLLLTASPSTPCKPWLVGVRALMAVTEWPPSFKFSNCSRQDTRFEAPQSPALPLFFINLKSTWCGVSPINAGALCAATAKLRPGVGQKPGELACTSWPLAAMLLCHSIILLAHQIFQDCRVPFALCCPKASFAESCKYCK
mmetsp:Transcript_87659/g.246233  ORF Transcript_87659/g.246233 Transcript_87659/m.246233 type:complete len:227 (+) Transcript_87659:154-834(+)